MQQEPPIPSILPLLAQRFQSLVWSCLDSDLTKTAVFHAERYYALDPHNHDSRHLYATALLREGQTHSALTLVHAPQDVRCSGCLEIQAKCCTALGRHRQAREALEATLQDPAYVPTGLFLTSCHNAVSINTLGQLLQVVGLHKYFPTKRLYAVDLVQWL
jgi:anaphase-promoting complex subunit 3